MKQTKRDPWLLALPKLELHCHLEGAVRPSTVWALSCEQGIELPAASEDEVASLVSAEGVCRNLVEYLHLFDPIMRCIQTADALRRIARELVEDEARCGAIYLETRFAPMQLLEKGLSPDDAIAAVLAGLHEGEQETGVVANAIVSCMRHHSPEQNDVAFESARRFLGKGVCAIDIAGDEAGYPPLTQQALFEKAARLNVPYTIHAGESAGAESIKEALLLGTKRLGHGVRVREDPNLMEYCRRKRIGMELCPTSNVHTHAVDGWDDLPIRAYLDEGLCVTINTDNPTISRTDLYEEYAALHERFSFGEAAFQRVAQNALDISFASLEQRAALQARLDRAFARR